MRSSRFNVLKASKYSSVDALRYIYGNYIEKYFHIGYKRGVLAKAGISYNEELKRIIKCLFLMEALLYYFSNQFIDNSIIVEYINWIGMDIYNVVNDALYALIRKCSHYNIAAIIGIIRLYDNIIDKSLFMSLRLLSNHYFYIVNKLEVLHY